MPLIRALLTHLRARSLPSLDCVKSFTSKWREEEGQFVTHARKYLGAVRPDSGIAFHETDRRVAPPTSALSEC